MPRTTPEAVAEIIEVDDFFPLEPCIEAANALVEEHCATAKDANGNPLMDDVRLELIERWLSAYVYALEDPRVTRESVGGNAVMSQYESKVDLGLDLNKYGQKAKLLDSSGNLAMLDYRIKKGLSVKRRPRVKWLGGGRDL